MSSTLATRVGIATVSGAILFTGAVTAAPANAATATDACVSSLRLIGEAYTLGKDSYNATKVLRKVTLPANQAAWNKQIKQIKQAGLSPQWQKRAIKATNIEFKAIRDWRIDETAVQVGAYDETLKFYRMGNETSCSMLNAPNNFTAALDAAIITVQNAVQNYDIQGDQLGSTYMQSMIKAFNKWNSGTLTVKSTKVLLKSMAGDTGALVKQAYLIHKNLNATNDGAMANYTNALANL